MGEVEMDGDDPITDGMRLSVRIRRDFVVTDAAAFAAAARRAECELHPEATPEHAAAVVTGAADALFAVLAGAGLLAAEQEVDEVEGLQPAGYRAQVVFDDPDALPEGCFGEPDDPFALPPGPPAGGDQGSLPG